MTQANGIKVGLIGQGISQSRTPKMHMAEGAALGLAYDYVLLDTDQMPEAERDLAFLLDRAEACGFAGVNVTFPYKQTALRHVHQQSDATRAVGATNTIVFRNGERMAHNTDYWGFATSFQRGLSDAPKDRVLLLGSGGAGGALAHALLENGVQHLMLYDVNPDMAAHLHHGLVARFGAARVVMVSDLSAAARDVDGIVNATPMGMAKLPGTAIPLPLLDPRHWVADIVYFPLNTALLIGARALGCRTLDGAGMAIFQAVRAFELFTGQVPDPARMRATFDSFDAVPGQG